MFAAQMNDDLLFSVFAFVFGACVGSFLNVCIYRLPLNLSINQPRRSFCPSCKRQIPWHQNLPLVSWLVLHGRCANCGARIAFRYFAVELLTAVFFLIIWKAFPWPIAVPHLMVSDRRMSALLISAGSAAFGYALLWLVLEGGKLVFGKKRIRLEKPTSFTWTRHLDDADFVVGDEKSLWSDFFARAKDQLLLHCSRAKIGKLEFTDAILRFHYNRVQVSFETF